jgi:anti-sigma regulatory factor (Ser/Thr protein kinase)
MHFTKDPECVAACRRFIEKKLGQRSPELRDRAVLVASELVTNVILHTTNGGTLEVVISPTQLRLEVSDVSQLHPVEGPPGLSTVRGRGLPIVSSLSDSWGVHDSRRGKTVWATFGISPD